MFCFLVFTDANHKQNLIHIMCSVLFHLRIDMPHLQVLVHVCYCNHVYILIHSNSCCRQTHTHHHIPISLLMRSISTSCSSPPLLIHSFFTSNSATLLFLCNDFIEHKIVYFGDTFIMNLVL